MNNPVGVYRFTLQVRYAQKYNANTTINKRQQGLKQNKYVKTNTVVNKSRFNKKMSYFGHVYQVKKNL